jgi:FixJ family two-component response regulator
VGIALLVAIPDIARRMRVHVLRRPAWCGAWERCLKAAMSDRPLISIVDDDRHFRESMRKLVTLLGYTVEAFPSAADFLASRLLLQTACLVSDVQMPGMSGVELHGRLIKLGYAIPTILITAYPDEAVRDEALKDGVICYLSKPVDDRDLERCIRSALKRVKPIEENS